MTRKIKLALISMCAAMMFAAFALVGCGSAPQINVNVEVDASVLAKDGTVSDPAIYSGTVSIDEDGTVYDALVATELEFEGNANYVSSIGGVKEGLAGSMSGWTYGVNDVSPDEIDKSCGDYILHDGDTVHWAYKIWGEK